MSVYETLWRRIKCVRQIAAPVTTRAGRCPGSLDRLLIGVATISLLALIASPLIGWQTGPGKALLVTSLALLAGAAAAFALNRRSGHLAGIFFLAFLTVILAAVGASAAGLALPVLLASLLLHPWAGIPIAALGVLLKAGFAFGPSGHPLDLPSLLALPVVALICWLMMDGLEQVRRNLHRSDQRLQQVEAHLRQAQKMEAMGRLTAGVAHDYNNYLTVMDSYACLLLDEMHPDEPNHEMVTQIQRAVELSRALTGQLLAFSRRQTGQSQVLNVNELIAGTEDILRRLAGREIELITCYDPNLGLVRADPGQIEQVLLNLVANARDAIAGAGTISIRTENVDAGHVLISVSDTGAGIDAETLPRIFEPFFTTKEAGSGTGLGLSTVYSIVRQSGGRVEVESELDQGTMFKVYLPRVTEE